MTFTEFKQSLGDNNPPAGINKLLQSLWYDAKDNWDKAHDIAQDISTADGSLLHAYLHRVEGDDWNAGYWYDRAGESRFAGSLDEEWQTLVKRFL